VSGARISNVGDAVAHIAAWLLHEGERCPPDRRQAERFLAALDPQAQGFSFRTFSDTPYTRLPGHDPLEDTLQGRLEDCWTELAERNRAGAAVSVTVNATDGRGRGPKHILRVRALFADLDQGGPVGSAADPPPHLLVCSSPGHYHAYWRVAELALRRFDAAQAALGLRLGSDRRAAAINQALRLPGFWHRKDPRNPHLVRLADVRLGHPYAPELLAAGTTADH